MERRVGMLFATVLITVLPGACSTHTSLEDDKRAAIAVVLAHELACQTYDFDKLDSLHTPDSQGIEESYPQPSEPGLRQNYQVLTNAAVRIDYRPQDAVAEVQGNVAWVTVTFTVSGRRILRWAGLCWEEASGMRPLWRATSW
jgi:hypothetical protein